jgi:hypothetical protein
MSYIKRPTSSPDNTSTSETVQCPSVPCEYTPAHPALLFKPISAAAPADHLDDYVEVDPFDKHGFQSAEGPKEPVNQDMPGLDTFSADLCSGVFVSDPSEAKIKKFIFWLFEDGPFSNSGLETMAKSKVLYSDHAEQADVIFKARHLQVDIPLTRGKRTFYRMRDGIYMFYLALKNYSDKVKGQLEHLAGESQTIKKILGKPALKGKTIWKTYLYILLQKMKGTGEFYTEIWDFFLRGRQGLPDITDKDTPPAFTKPLGGLEAYAAYKFMKAARDAAIKAAQAANNPDQLADAIALPGWGFERAQDHDARQNAIRGRNEAKHAGKRKQKEDKRKAAARAAN